MTRWTVEVVRPGRPGVVLATYTGIDVSMPETAPGSVACQYGVWLYGEENPGHGYGTLNAVAIPESGS